MTTNPEHPRAHAIALRTYAENWAAGRVPEPSAAKVADLANKILAGVNELAGQGAADDTGRLRADDSQQREKIAHAYHELKKILALFDATAEDMDVADVSDFVGEEVDRLRAALETAHRQVDRSIRRLQQVQDPRSPRVVCICGSMRFQFAMVEASIDESLAGRIVLLPLVNMKNPDARWESEEQAERIKRDLDRLHFAKIDRADEVLVVNPGGYIGESTKREIAYAEELGIPVRYLTQVSSPTPEPADEPTRKFDVGTKVTRHDLFGVGTVTHVYDQHHRRVSWPKDHYSREHVDSLREVSSQTGDQP